MAVTSRIVICAVMKGVTKPLPPFAVGSRNRWAFGLCAIPPDMLVTSQKQAGMSAAVDSQRTARAMAEVLMALHICLLRVVYAQQQVQTSQASMEPG